MLCYFLELRIITSQSSAPFCASEEVIWRESWIYIASDSQVAVKALGTENPKN